MRFAAEKEMAHIGESQAARDHDHDMIHELSKRLDSVWRMDQYIANAEGDINLENFWRHLKQEEQRNVERLKQLIKDHCEKDCF